jgi:hypothetical protein
MKLPIKYGWDRKIETAGCFETSFAAYKTTGRSSRKTAHMFAAMKVSNLM